MKDRINIVIILIITSLIFYYSLDIKTKYPKWVIIGFNEPIIRFLIYLLVFGLTFYNPLVAFVLLIGVVMLHLDYNKLCHTSFLISM